MSSIVDILAREIIDSRGNPTVECDVVLDSGVIGRASVPSGASTGSGEAIELRDSHSKRFYGKGVKTAVSNINNEITELLLGLDVRSQSAIDHELIALDGTENKSRLGANAMLAVSLSVAKAAATECKLPLYRYFGDIGTISMPVPMMNVINGGVHANNNLDIQEMMIIPAGFSSFSEALRCGCEIFQTLKKVINKKGMSLAVGDEGGFAPDVKSHSEALDLIMEAITLSGYKPGEEVSLALDCASTEFFENGKYNLKGENLSLDPKKFVELLESWCNRYPIISVEDGAAEDDWSTWELLTEKLGSRIQLVGDDLFVTNTKLLQKGISRGIANSILIKINQIGTLTETFAAISLAKRHGYSSVISHRSGETEDTTIADIAVGSNALQIKTGSLSRTDRTAKYNQLLRIEEDIGKLVHYPGYDAFKKNLT
ncbi:MAG: phosphopyruvate hydratase [Betaproteobacteria bacterium TMED41]|nr:MAG: phosphopyruvate hydratase [Betaproteobacteria bacterium TMED41]